MIFRNLKLACSSEGRFSPLLAYFYRPYLPILIITILAAFLRLYGLADQGLWYDEGCSIYLSDYAAHWNQLFNVDYNNDPPLFLMLLLVWRSFVSLLPVHFPVDWMLRLLPCLFSILTIPVIYAAARTLFHYRAGKEADAEPGVTAERTALAAAFIVALSPFHRFYAQELRGYSLLVLLSALVIWCFFLALQHKRLRHWMLLSLFLALSFWTHFFSAWLFLVLNLYLLLTLPIHKDRYVPWAFSQGVAVLLCLPALYLAWQVSQIVNTISVQWIPPPDMKTLLITFKAFFAGYSPRSLAYWPLFLLGAVLSLAGLWSLRRRPALLIYLLLWAGFAMTASAIIWASRDFSYYEHRLFIWSALAAAMLAACGWASLMRSLRLLSAMLFILLTLPLLYDSAAHTLHPLPQHRLGVRYKVDNRGACEFLSREAFADEVVFHVSHVTLPSFRFYLPDHPHRHICRTEEEEAGFFNAYPNRALWMHLDFYPTLWGSLESYPNTFWLVRSWWEPFEIPDNLRELEEEISTAYETTGSFSFYGILLTHLERKRTVSSE